MNPADLTRLSAGLTAEYLEFNGIIPLAMSGDAVEIGGWQTTVDTAVLDDIALHFGLPVTLVQIPEAVGLAAVRRLYSAQPNPESRLGSADEADQLGVSDLRMLANEAPVVQTVNLLLLEGLERRASDVHLEATSDRLIVRYRIDGVLRDATSPPLQMAAALLSRLKIMANLDIAERRMPQDGRIRLRLDDRDVDVRMSTIPTLHGESVALRLLDATRGRIALEGIGMPAAVLDAFRSLISRKHGLILVTGPTGSGKTTTMYAAVEAIRTGHDKIVTIEDPVEYQLTGVSQMPINPKQGVTFSTALRAVLRHDPDVIMVGEIRDAETAQIATQAALTGHLVLATLHTIDSATAIDRLSDLGVDRYLIADTLQGILAQRLVRQVCPCTRGVPGEASSCRDCGATGYAGRTGVYELMCITPGMAGAIQAGQAADDYRRRACAEGMVELARAAGDLVRLGVTTQAEVSRVLASGSMS